MRKVDYEYKVADSLAEGWYVTQYIFSLKYVLDSPFFDTRQECYAWIEQQEGENEQ